ncbi:MAG: hypothetical protein ACFFCH_03020 [Promethearchaeota archaeon]
MGSGLINLVLLLLYSTNTIISIYENAIGYVGEHILLVLFLYSTGCILYILSGFYALWITEETETNNL